jgi:hypothetical protein
MGRPFVSEGAGEQATTKAKTNAGVLRFAQNDALFAARFVAGGLERTGNGNSRFFRCVAE